MRLPPFSSRDSLCRASAPLLLALLIPVGCAHAPAAPPQGVAVMPVEVLGIEPERGVSLRESIEGAAAELSSVTLTPSVAVDEALAAHHPAERECLEADLCLASLGLALKAPTVLAVTLAGLGDTNLVRSRLISAEQGLALQDLQETVVGGPEGMRSYATDLVRRLFPETPEAPWYRRWWVWAGSAVVLGTATAVTVVLVRRSAHDSGVVHIGDL